MAVQQKVSTPRVATFVVGILTVIGGLILVGMVLATIAVLLPGHPLCLTDAGGGFYGNFAGARAVGAPQSQCNLGTDATLLAVAIQLLWPLFCFVALVLLFQLLRTASREGPFHAAVASRMSTLVAFVAIGGPVIAVVADLLTHWVLDREYFYVGPDNLWGFPWITLSGIGVYPWFMLVVGLGTIAFAGILRSGARMREDLEGTI